METQIEWALTSPDGIEYVLHAPPERFISADNGSGVSEHDIAITQTPFQQGETVLSQRLRPRQIQFDFFHKACSFSDGQTVRDTLVDLVRENRTPLYSPSPWVLTKKYIQNRQYVARALDVFFTSGFAFETRSQGYWNEWAVKETLVFTAYSPLWYDPTVVTYTLSTFTNALILPFSFPFILGGAIASGTLTYTGQWETFPQVTITGPAQNVTLVNNSTGREVNLDYGVLYGNNVTIDLSPLVKRAYDACGSDLTPYLLGDVDVFSIQSTPLVAGGLNALSFYTEVAGTTTAVAVRYYNQYRGL